MQNLAEVMMIEWNRENVMALSHRLAAGVVSLLYKLCGQRHFPFSKAHVIANDREG